MRTFLFSGTSNPKLAQKISKLAKIRFGKIDIKRFSDQEIYVNVKENVKGKNVFVLQSCSTPGNEYLMELLILIDALKRLRPRKITAIIPFYPYRRQERKVERGESVTAELVARLLETARVNKVVLCDIHSEKILGFFKIPVAHLTALSLFVNYFKKKNLKDAMVIAPDQGALQVNRKLAKNLGIPVTFIKKSRMRKHDVVPRMEVPKEVKNKNIIMLDDEINTAGTIVKTAQLLKKQGVKNIYMAATHTVLSGPAIQRIKKSPIKEIIVTDTIAIPKQKQIKKIKIVSSAGLFSSLI